MPSGGSNARSIAKAISWMVLTRSGLPFTKYFGPSISMSSTDASSMCAANLRASRGSLWSLDRGGHPDRRCARAVRAVAERRALGVRVLDDDVLHRDAQLVRDDLRVRRLVALALRLGAHGDDRLPGQVHLDVGRFPHRRAPAFADRADPLGWRDAAHLDVGREAGAQELAAGLGLRLGGGQRAVAGHLERLVEGGLVVAGSM